MKEHALGPLTFAPLVPRDWVYPGPKVAQVEGEDRDLEECLKIPINTVGYIRWALAEGLGRATGWDLGRLRGDTELAGDSGAIRAAETAGSLFRRGVVIRGGEGWSGPEAAGGIQGTPTRIACRENPPGLFEEAENRGFWKDLLTRDRVGRVLLVADPALDGRDLAALMRMVGSSIRTVEGVRWVLREPDKTLRGLARLLATVVDPWMARGRDPGCLVLAGGGALLDVGMLGATLRGLPTVMVPTTLLAMVDAAVGGKCAVNFAPFGKNQVGLFAEPRGVWVDPKWLTTLPRRELCSGAVEGVKHLVLDGRLEPGPVGLVPMIEHSLQFKCRVVECDAGEVAERRSLNLGHTLGHAIESLSQGQCLHGECVALGIVMSVEVSVRRGLLAQADARAVLSLVESTGVVEGLRESRRILERLPVDRLMEQMQHDKKRQFAHDLTLVEDVLLESTHYRRIQAYAGHDKSYLTCIRRDEVVAAWTQVRRWVDGVLEQGARACLGPCGRSARE